MHRTHGIPLRRPLGFYHRSHPLHSHLTTNQNKDSIDQFFRNAEQYLQQQKSVFTEKILEILQRTTFIKEWKKSGRDLTCQERKLLFYTLDKLQLTMIKGKKKGYFELAESILLSELKFSDLSSIHEIVDKVVENLKVKNAERMKNLMDAIQLDIRNEERSQIAFSRNLNKRSLFIQLTDSPFLPILFNEKSESEITLLKKNLHIIKDRIRNNRSDFEKEKNIEIHLKKCSHNLAQIPEESEDLSHKCENLSLISFFLNDLYHLLPDDDANVIKTLVNTINNQLINSVKEKITIDIDKKTRNRLKGSGDGESRTEKLNLESNLWSFKNEVCLKRKRQISRSDQVSISEDITHEINLTAGVKLKKIVELEAEIDLTENRSKGYDSILVYAREIAEKYLYQYLLQNYGHIFKKRSDIDQCIAIVPQIKCLQEELQNLKIIKKNCILSLPSPDGIEPFLIFSRGISLGAGAHTINNLISGSVSVSKEKNMTEVASYLGTSIQANPKILNLNELQNPMIESIWEPIGHKLGITNHHFLDCDQEISKLISTASPKQITEVRELIKEQIFNLESTYDHYLETINTLDYPKIPMHTYEKYHHFQKEIESEFQSRNRSEFIKTTIINHYQLRNLYERLTREENDNPTILVDRDAFDSIQLKYNNPQISIPKKDYDKYLKIREISSGSTKSYSAIIDLDIKMIPSIKSSGEISMAHVTRSGDPDSDGRFLSLTFELTGELSLQKLSQFFFSNHQKISKIADQYDLNRDDIHKGFKELLSYCQAIDFNRSSGVKFILKFKETIPHRMTLLRGRILSICKKNVKIRLPILSWLSILLNHSHRRHSKIANFLGRDTIFFLRSKYNSLQTQSDGWEQYVIKKQKDIEKILLNTANHGTRAHRELIILENEVRDELLTNQQSPITMSSFELCSCQCHLMLEEFKVSQTEAHFNSALQALTDLFSLYYQSVYERKLKEMISYSIS